MNDQDYELWKKLVGTLGELTLTVAIQTEEIKALKTRLIKQEDLMEKVAPAAFKADARTRKY